MAATSRFHGKEELIAVLYRARVYDTIGGASMVAQQFQGGRNVTKRDLADLAAHTAQGTNRNKSSPEENLGKMFVVYTASSPLFTRGHAKAASQSAFALLKAPIPNPALFVTLSNDDTHDITIVRAIVRQSTLGELFGDLRFGGVLQEKMEATCGFKVEDLAHPSGLTAEQRAAYSREGKQFIMGHLGLLPFAARARCVQLRPELAAFCYYQKITATIREIWLSENNPLGKVMSYWYRVEFQARGSPHIHGIIWSAFSASLREHLLGSA